MAWNLLDPALPSRLEQCPQPVLRALALHVCQAATEHVGLSNDVIHAAIAALTAQRYDHGDLRDEVEAVVTKLDERQWNLQDQVDEGKASKEEQIQAFCRARAANAVLAALSIDPLVAAQGAVYEANFALGDWMALKVIINQHLEDVNQGE